MLANRAKTASQIEFRDPKASNQFKSLYLDTLGAEAFSRGQDDSSAAEGYIHGALSTAGISGASPAVHSLTKQQARIKAQEGQRDARPAAGADTASSQVCSAAADWDPGMRPKQRHPVSTNRPDFAHTTLDIDGAQPHSRTFFKAPRNTDPQNPQYKLSDSPTLPLPSGPPPADKLLRDPLNVADIPGATNKPATPSSNRPGQLDVSDIEGSNTHWKAQHRHHTATKLRDAGLDVHDINMYMARFKPEPRSTLLKGHPAGPRVQPRVKPRCNLSVMDNSLRTLDIEGTKAVLSETRIGVRQPHNHITSVADIEGAAPADRDRVRLFERKSAAAAVMVAQHEAAQAVLSGLSLESADLSALWKHCRNLDRDSSGYLTAHELQSAMQSACLQLRPPDTERLLTALKDNAGLLNYKKLTQQLKGRVSRPSSTKQLQMKPQQPAATGVQVAQQQQEQVQTASNGPAASSVQGFTAQPDGSCTAAEAASAIASCTAEIQQVNSQAAAAATHIAGQLCQQQQRRPHTAPGPKTRGANAGSTGGSTDESYKTLSHWFGGSRRDITAATDGAAWRPGQDVELLIGRSNTPDGDIVTPWVLASGSGSGGSSSNHMSGQSQSSGCSFSKQQGEGPGCNAQARCGPDIVPGWVVGADPVHGTFKVVHPFRVQGLGDGAAGSTTLEAACSEQPVATGNCSAGAGPVSADCAVQCIDAESSSNQRTTPTAFAPGTVEHGRLPCSTVPGAKVFPVCKVVATVAALPQRRPASAAPCCGRSSSRGSNASSASGLAGMLAPASFRAVERIWDANGINRTSVLGARGGSSRSITSRCLSGGADDMDLLDRQRPVGTGVQQKQRPQSASAVRMQRPASVQPAGQCNAVAGVSRALSTAVVAPAVPSHADSGTTAHSSRPVYAHSNRPLPLKPCTVGLAEQRRLIESMQQDLTAVRLLP